MEENKIYPNNKTVTIVTVKEEPKSKTKEEVVQELKKRVQGKVSEDKK